MNTIQNISKICFFGPSGSGKSTCADFAQRYLQQHYLVEKINVSQPLHQIQNYAYTLFDLPNTGQDGPLLQFIAKHFETHLGPSYLQKIRKLEQANTNQSLVIINSDCRDNSYQYLKELGFKFIRVYASSENIDLRLQARGDVSLAQKNHSVEQTAHIVADYFLDNNNSLVDLEDKVKNIIDNILHQTRRYCLRDLF